MKRTVLSILFFLVACTSLMLVLTACGHEHSFGEWATEKQATCIDTGIKVRMCDCGKQETETIPSTGHTDGEWITDKEANCTEDGSRHQVCTNCGETLKTETIPSTGHTDGEWITDKEANCTEDGSRHQVCTNCGETLKTETISATGHSYGEWTIVNAPTCTESGTQIRACSCGKIEAQTIPESGHTTTTGVCERCHEFLEPPVNIRIDKNEVINCVNMQGTTGYTASFDNIKATVHNRGEFYSITVEYSLSELLTGLWIPQHRNGSSRAIDAFLADCYLRLTDTNGTQIATLPLSGSLEVDMVYNALENGDFDYTKQAFNLRCTDTFLDVPISDHYSIDLVRLKPEDIWN